MQVWIAYLRFVFIYMWSWETVLSIIMPATLEGLNPVPMKIWTQSIRSLYLNAASNIKYLSMKNYIWTISNIIWKFWWPIEKQAQRSNKRPSIIIDGIWEELKSSWRISVLSLFSTTALVWEICPYILHS